MTLRSLASVAEGGVGFETSRGSVLIWEPSAKVQVMRFEGYAEAELVPPFIERLNRFTANGRDFSIFIDLEPLQGYASEIRTNATESARGFLGRATALQFLVTSKLVAMGVAVANLALGGRLKAHNRRADFLAALDAALRPAGVTGFAARAGLDSLASVGSQR